MLFVHQDETLQHTGIIRGQTQEKKGLLFRKMLQRFFPGKHIVLTHIINDSINVTTEKTELKPDALF